MSTEDRIKMGKRGPAPTTGKGITIGVRCQGAFLAELDEWRQKQPVVPARAAALRYLAVVGMRTEKPALRKRAK
jgi:hypothetical protein